MRAAVLDIGSNSVQLLVADIRDGAWQERIAAECVTRLAAGLAAGHSLDATARARTLRAVRALTTRARAAGAERVCAVGTRAFRLAADGAAFAARLGDVIGESMEVLSAAAEAELGFLGAVGGLGCTRGPVLAIDVGGGSSEIVFGQDAVPVERQSLPIGAVVMTDSHLRHDPPSAEEVAALRTAVADAARGAPAMQRHRSGSVVGSGGTLVTLAAIAARLERYRPEIVHGSRLTMEVLQAQCAELARHSIAERRAIPGLDPARAPTILAGALIVTVLLEMAGSESLLVSDRGLRHAVLETRVMSGAD